MKSHNNDIFLLFNTLIRVIMVLVTTTRSNIAMGQITHIGLHLNMNRTYSRHLVHLLNEYTRTITIAMKTRPSVIWNLRFCHQNFLLTLRELIRNSLARLVNSSDLSFRVSIRSPRSITLFILDCITLVSWSTSFWSSFILLPPGSTFWPGTSPF